MGNMYIVDGLDVTSAIRPGVLNLQPNPDSVQEVSIQVNTYTVDYGRASSMQMVITTKPGGDRYHGSASDYFNNQSLWTSSDFAKQSDFAKYHANNHVGHGRRSDHPSPPGVLLRLDRAAAIGSSGKRVSFL
jgi:hypothetical protein